MPYLGEKNRLIALSDCVGDEWRRAIREGGRAHGVGVRSSFPDEAARAGPMAAQSSCVHKRWRGATPGILPRPMRVRV